MAVRTARWDCIADTAVRAKGDWDNGDREGAPGRGVIMVGKREGYVHRSYVKFNVDQSPIGYLHSAHLVLTTIHDDWPPGPTPSVKVQRLIEDWPEGVGMAWHESDKINPQITDAYEAWAPVNPAYGAQTSIDVTALVGPWLDHWRSWPYGSGWDKPIVGFRLRTGEDDYNDSVQFGAKESSWGTGVAAYLQITYDPPNLAPDYISTIQPVGDPVLRGLPFTGQFGDPNGDKPEAINIEVYEHPSGNLAWAAMEYYDLDWYDEGNGFWRWSIENPGSAVLKDNIEYRWKARGWDVGGLITPWTPLIGFIQRGQVPTVSPRPIGILATLGGFFFTADWATEPGEGIVLYRAQLKSALLTWEDPPLWDEVFTPLTQTEQELGYLRFPYGGPTLQSGYYDLRLAVVDSRGVSSAWSDDARFVLTVGSGDPDQDGGGQPPFSTGFQRMQSRIRIILRATDGPYRGPGTIKAIIEDAHNIGFSQVVNEPGEFYFTLTSLHPQAPECEPYQRHFALQQYRNGGWQDICNGLLTDFDAGDDDIVIYGLDYLGILSRSVDTRFPQTGNLELDHAQGGAKYKNQKISTIVQEQLQHAMAMADSPIAFFNIGIMQELNTEVSIYSSFKQRLDFIRGLLESHRQGTGRRTRLRARKDPSQTDRWEWDLRHTPGIDRDDLRLEYGSNLQNFRVIAMGEDYATRAHGVGTQANEVKPQYWVEPPEGAGSFLTATFGNLQRVEVYEDLIDQNDLKRRVKQLVKETSKVGKRMRLAIKVHSIDPFDGYDLTDNIPIDIDRGLVETDRYGSGYWTLWGLEYRVFPDGHDELTWAVKPREDDELPDPDLLPSDPIHHATEWALGSGPPPPCVGTPVLRTVTTTGAPTPCECYFYLDLDTGTVYQRLGPDYEEWTEQGTIPGDGSAPPPPGGWYPGDLLPPPQVTGLAVLPGYTTQQDGTPVPSFRIGWDLITTPTDIVGYEVQWDARENSDAVSLGDPADWLTHRVLKVGADVVDVTVTDHVVGNTAYDIRVRCYDVDGYYGPWSAIVTERALIDETVPAVPVGMTAASGYKSIAVAWDPNLEPDFSFYDVEVFQTSDIAGTTTHFTTSTSRLVVGGLLDSIEYGIRIRAVDRSGNTSDWSVTVTAIPTLVLQADMVFDSIYVSEFVDTGELQADAITSGTLTLGGPEADGPYLVVLDDTLPEPVEMLTIDKTGMVTVDPSNPDKAMRWREGRLEFTNNYTEDPVIWTAALSADGLVADVIRLGSQPGGHNTVKNSGFELAPLGVIQTAVWTSAANWASHIGAVNANVATNDLKMADWT